MLLIAADQKRKFLIRGFKSRNFRYRGYLRHQLSKELAVLEELAQAIAIDSIQLHFSQSYLSSVILKF